MKATDAGTKADGGAKNLLDDYRAVWFADWAYDRPPGETPQPVRLDASELRSGRTVRRDAEELWRDGLPFDTGRDVLVVVFGATSLGCHLTLHRPLPKNVLDLHAEFRRHVAGSDVDYDELPEHALAYFGLPGRGPAGLRELAGRLLPGTNLPRALHRGRYAKAAARMEATGVPLDGETLGRLREDWDGVLDELVERTDREFRVMRGRWFDQERWAAWCRRRGIAWPALATQTEILEALRDASASYPEVGPMKELLATLWRVKPLALPVGSDGRNRCSLRPWASKTGRNQPRTSEFVFGPASWVRHLIKPAEGRAVAYLDYQQQEFGIAAALSGDPAMLAAYRSGDPYLAFANQAGAVPGHATKDSHPRERELFKHCALGLQYGMTAWSLSKRLGVSLREAGELIGLHRRTYRRYWAWSDEVVGRAVASGRMRTEFGWTMNVETGTKARTLRNFPLQANGAEVLRMACCLLTEAGIAVCCPVHDAVLIEAPTGEIREAAEAAAGLMRKASGIALRGMPLGVDARSVSHPGRYEDARGAETWRRVNDALTRGLCGESGRGSRRRKDVPSNKDCVRKSVPGRPAGVLSV